MCMYVYFFSETPENILHMSRFFTPKYFGLYHKSRGILFHNYNTVINFIDLTFTSYLYLSFIYIPILSVEPIMSFYSIFPAVQDLV